MMMPVIASPESEKVLRNVVDGDGEEGNGAVVVGLHSPNGGVERRMVLGGADLELTRHGESFDDALPLLGGVVSGV